MRAVRPVRRILAASRAREGISSVLRKSPPVPLGSIPSSASLPDDKIPFATSEMVPSPPHAIINFAPLRAASLASAAASPRCFVNRTRNEPNCERRSLAICGHASPVLPPADDGLTITTDIFFPQIPQIAQMFCVICGWLCLLRRAQQFLPSPHQQFPCAFAVDPASASAH